MAATLSRAIEVYPPGSITGGGRDCGAPDTYRGAIALASEMRQLAERRLPKEPPNPLPLSEWMLLDGRLRGALHRAAGLFDEPIAGELRGAAER